MDDRPEKICKPAISVIKSADTHFQISMAGNLSSRTSSNFDGILRSIHEKSLWD